MLGARSWIAVACWIVWITGSSISPDEALLGVGALVCFGGAEGAGQRSHGRGIVYGIFHKEEALPGEFGISQSMKHYCSDSIEIRVFAAGAVNRTQGHQCSRHRTHTDGRIE